MRNTSGRWNGRNLRWAVCAAHLALLVLPVRAAEKQPAYVPASALRADAAVGPNPFAWESPGSMPAPTPPQTRPPANIAHLALLRPYRVSFDPAPATVVEPQNPFLSEEIQPVPKLDAPKEAAGDWYQSWPVTWTGTAWTALEAAWTRDAAAVRKAFRDETKRDWPLDTVSVQDEIGRIAATNWVEARWNKAVQARVTAWRTANGLRGPVIIRAPLDGALSALSAGSAAGHPAPTLTPRVTTNASVNRYGVGFLLRLTADLGRRIPWPVLDLSALTEAEASWGALWLNEAVRNGVQGLDILPPVNTEARAALEAAVKPLDGPNVYLPPPSEIGIFVSRDTLARERGAWVSLFMAYAALRDTGIWPEFVSDEQVRGREVSLARFNLLVVPAARWATMEDSAAMLARAERGGIVAITDPFAFRDRLYGIVGWKSLDAAPTAPDWLGYEPPVIVPDAGVKTLVVYPDARIAVTERRVGDGAILGSGMDAFGTTPLWRSFWRDTARRAGVPSRPWLGSVTAANVGSITGTWRKPVVE